jgi:predicted phosphodiesterase
MKIKLVSDLHLEFGDINIKNDEGCDVLILSGDIMVAQDLYDHPDAPSLWDLPNTQGMGRRQAAALRYRDFLKRVSFQFPHVVYVAGNHEFYHGKWHKTLEILAEECAKFPNVYFMDCDSKTINDVTFIAGTLWTDCNKQDPLTMHALKDMMNDYKAIRVEYDGFRRLRPEDTVVRHFKMLNYIKTVTAEKHDQKFVVVGHHSPSFQSVHESYAHDQLMNGGYHSELSEFILDRPQIKLWTHGHTHFPFDYTIGETRIVCNPRGYDGYELTGWNPNIVIEV